MRTGQDELLATAEKLLALRGFREKNIIENTFGDPAWELMLAVYVAQCQGSGLPLQSVPEAIGLSTPVSLRWLRILQDRGLMTHERAPDRVETLRLSSKGIDGLEATLQCLKSLGSAASER